MATRWGIVGCGLIAADFVKALGTIGNPGEEHTVVAAAARDIDRAQAFAQNFGIPKAYGSYKELAEDPDVEVVYIATLCKDHFDHCKLFLDRGKNVFCEKPLCVNVQLVKEIIGYAKEKNVFFMEAMWARFNPVYVQLREEIEKGTIGDILHVNSVFGFDQSLRDPWVYSREGNGGGLLDMGIYNVHLALVTFWGEKPEEIITSGFLNESGVDLSTTTTLVYSKGRTATSVTTMQVDMPNQAVIVGTKGQMILKSPFWTSPELVTPNKTYTFPDPLGNTNFPRSYYLRYEAMEVRRCLKEGLKNSPRMSWDDSIALHEILTEIRIKNGVVYDQDKAYMNPAA